MISALLSMAAFLGLQELAEYLAENANTKNGMTSNQIINAIKTITNTARTKGTKAIQFVSDKLNAMQMPLGYSQTVKTALSNARQNLKKELNKLTKDYSKIETNLNNIDEAASNLAAQSAGIRFTDPSRKLKEDLITQAGNALNDVNKIEGVEKYVQEENKN